MSFYTTEACHNCGGVFAMEVPEDISGWQWECRKCGEWNSPESILHRKSRRTKAADLLDQAAALVDGDRNQQHGDKERSFECIAEAWSWWLQHRHKAMVRNGEVLEPLYLDGADVAKMMQYVKDGRFLYGQPLKEHTIDNLGYGAIFGELSDESPPDSS